MKTKRYSIEKRTVASCEGAEKWAFESAHLRQSIGCQWLPPPHTPAAMAAAAAATTELEVEAVVRAAFQALECPIW